jgi:hypothetical protein
MVQKFLFVFALFFAEKTIIAGGKAVSNRTIKIQVPLAAVNTTGYAVAINGETSKPDKTKKIYLASFVDDWLHDAFALRNKNQDLEKKCNNLGDALLQLQITYKQNKAILSDEDTEVIEV